MVGLARLTRPFVAAALVGAALFLPALPARATGVLTVSPGIGPPGTLVTLTGGGFVPNEAVQIEFDGAVLMIRWVDATGTLSTQIGVPKYAKPGPHTFLALGVSQHADSGAFFVLVEWRQFHFEPRQTGWNPYEVLLRPDTVPRLTQQWARATRGSIEDSPITFGFTVLVGSDDGRLYALDRGTGGVLWTAATGGKVIGSPIAIKGFDPQPDPPGKVLVGSMDGKVYAYDTRGTRLWATGLGAPISTSLAAAKGFDPQPDPPGKVFVGTDLGSVYALSSHDGRTLWKRNLDGTGISGAPTPVRGGRTVPSRIIVATRGGTLAAVATHDGRVLWRTRMGSARGSPVVADLDADGVPDIVIGSANGKVHAFDTTVALPHLLWSFRTGGAIRGTVAVGNLGGRAGVSVVAASADGDVYAIDTTEARPVPRWRASLGTPLETSPALGGGVVYVGGDDSRLRALRGTDGRILFTSSAVTCTQSSPIVVDGRVYVGTMHGAIYAYQGPDT
jgi:outer membrane protein assembly factor BamB